MANLLKAGWIALDALVAIEPMKNEPFEVPAGFTELDSRTYRKAKLVFLKYGG